MRARGNWRLTGGYFCRRLRSGMLMNATHQQQQKAAIKITYAALDCQNHRPFSAVVAAVYLFARLGAKGNPLAYEYTEFSNSAD
jgi:hypothetical protein